MMAVRISRTTSVMVGLWIDLGSTLRKAISTNRIRDSGLGLEALTAESKILSRLLPVSIVIRTCEVG